MLFLTNIKINFLGWEGKWNNQYIKISNNNNNEIKLIT